MKHDEMPFGDVPLLSGRAASAQNVYEELYVIVQRTVCCPGGGPACFVALKSLMGQLVDECPDTMSKAQMGIELFRWADGLAKQYTKAASEEITAATTGGVPSDADPLPVVG